MSTMSTSPKPDMEAEPIVIDQPEDPNSEVVDGGEQEEEEEDEEEEVVPRRSTRVRKPVIKAPPPKLDLGSDSDLSDAPVKRRRRRKAKATVIIGENGEEMVVEPPKRKRKRPTEEGDLQEEGAPENETANDDEKPPPKKRAARKKKTAEEGGETAKLENGAEDVTETGAAPAPTAPAPKRKRAPKKPKEEGETEDAKKSTSPKENVDGTENPEGEESKPKRIRKPRVKEPVVYVIPDVERKTTTFRGRLGYACLNTVLRAQRPSVYSSRTCRIDTIQKSGLDHVKELGRQNLKDLMATIEWNEKNNIRFMRMSSDMFPFASHATYGYDLSYCQEELKAVGDLANKYGHRLTAHPGQYTQLASPKENVVESSIKELEYHAEMMDRMGLDQDSVMIIHMGGVYGDKVTTLARFKDNYQKKLSDAVKRRLVLENDEICYNVDDLLKVCPQLNIPIIFDYHHDAINPSRRSASELIPLINQTWQARGIKPKQHLSQARPGAVTAMELRAHADRCTELPADLPDDMDLMIEAKDKEQAVFELYRIYGLHDVIWENLRPPSEEQSMRTKGRKSSGGKKKKDQKEGAEAPAAEEQPLDPEMIDELADDDDL